MKVEMSGGSRTEQAGRMVEEALQALESSSEMAQSYAVLASSLRVGDRSNPLKSLLLTSAQPGEGKTTVALNLALTMMLNGKRVAILDADVRRPSIHRLLELPNTAGLADLAREDVRIEDVIQTLKVGWEGSEADGSVIVITGGRGTPRGLDVVGTSRLLAVVEHLGSTSDFVVVDSPPVLAVSDSLLLAPMLDGVVLVLNTGVVSEYEAKRTKERLEQAGGRILGVVLNRFDERLHGPSFTPYSGSYGAGG